MPLLRRATENTASLWQNVPEGVWRWVIGKPEIKIWPKGDYGIKFPLELIESEKKRADEEVGELPEDVQQSYRSSYTPGLSLGYFKQGAFQTTKLVDFLCFTLGTGNAKQFRKWIAEGGGPPRPEDRDDADAELKMIVEWMGWFEGLEILGSIRHEVDKKDPNQTWARFGGPMPVGSLPGQKDDDYQALARGKMRAILADSGETRESNTAKEPVAAAPARTYNEVFPAQNDDEDDLPF